MRIPNVLAVTAVLLALAGCTSSQDVLEPSAIKPPPAPSNMAAPDTAPIPTPSPSGQVATTAPAPAATPSDAGAIAQARVQFAPVVGPSVAAATTLSERLVGRSRTLGIGLARTGGPPATHLLRGYFSALREGGDVTVVFVWDVYDPAGNRIHRISGQQKARAGSGDGWDAVPPATMQSVADVTIDDLAAWLGRSRG